MIRPGMSRPAQGADRTRNLRQRLSQMMVQRGPRFAGAMGRRPVAGPGVRQFSSGRGPLQPAALEALTQRFGGGVIPHMRPTPGLPEQAQAAALDTLPDPGAGAQGRAFFSSGRGGQQSAALGWDREYLADALGAGPGQTSVIRSPVLAGLRQDALPGNIIPLGGGAYFDANTGQVHGMGGAPIAF